MKIDQIIRSNRKTIAIEIKPDGQLVVRAPKHTPQKQIQAIVDQKSAWIANSRAKLAQKFPDLKPKTFTPGEKFWYLGHQYPLLLKEGARPPLELDGAFLLSRKALSRAKDVFIEWYREETRGITKDLIERYSKAYHFNVGVVTVNSARTRWGSCSGKNNLNFTYRLSMAPLSVIEYVVVHELAHLKVRNHSQSFWNTVAAIRPGYQQDRRWLKEHGPLLTLD